MWGQGDEKLTGAGSAKAEGRVHPACLETLQQPRRPGQREVEARGCGSMWGQACRALGGAVTGLVCWAGKFLICLYFMNRIPGESEARRTGLEVHSTQGPRRTYRNIS